jgi:hypothetical protein
LSTSSLRVVDQVAVTAVAAQAGSAQVQDLALVPELITRLRLAQVVLAQL